VKSRGSVLYFDLLHVPIFIQQNIQGAMDFCENGQNSLLAVAGNLFWLATRAAKELK